MGNGTSLIKIIKGVTNLMLVAMLLFITTGCGNKVQASFLALSDIHFSPYATCQVAKSPCLIIEKLQAAPASQWASILQQYDTPTPSKDGSDTNAALLSSMLQDIKTLPNTYRFVLLTGDFLAHNYQQNFMQFTGDKSLTDYKQFVEKTYQYLQLQLQQTFPTTPVYIALGNNDSFDGNYYSNPNGDFYKDLTQIWQSMIPDAANKAAFEKTFPQAGYYAITLPTRTKLTNRVIFLNTVLFSAIAKGPNIAAAGQQELDWLQQQLQSAQKAKQHVWLVYHIPNGVDAYYTVNRKTVTMLWQPQYNEAFLKLLNQYSDTITALITAHIHMDGAQIFHFHNRVRLLNTFVSSVSPIYGNNPAFKIYDFAPHSMRLNNFQTYYLSDPTKGWSLEYDFNKVFQPYCHPCRILNGYSTITASGWRTDQYKKFFGVSTESQYITQGYWMPYYWCAMQHQTLKGYQTCLTSVLAAKNKRTPMHAMS